MIDYQRFPDQFLNSPILKWNEVRFDLYMSEFCICDFKILKTWVLFLYLKSNFHNFKKQTFTSIHHKSIFQSFVFKPFPTFGKWISFFEVLRLIQIFHDQTSIFCDQTSVSDILWLNFYFWHFKTIINILWPKIKFPIF